MRTFRNAALAGATALALTFGGTAVAGADEPDTTLSSAQTQNGSSLANKIGKEIFKIEGEGDPSDTLNGREIFGIGDDNNLSGQPFGAQLLYFLTVILGISAVASLLIAPVDNFLKYGPFAS